MIFVHEGERPVGLNAIRKIGIAAGHQDEVAFQRAVLVDRTGAIHASVEAVVGAEFGEDGAFGKELGGGGGNEKLLGVQGVNSLASFKIVKFNAEIRTCKFRPRHHFLDARLE